MLADYFSSLRNNELDKVELSSCRINPCMAAADTIVMLVPDFQLDPGTVVPNDLYYRPTLDGTVGSFPAHTSEYCHVTNGSPLVGSWGCSTIPDVCINPNRGIP